MKEQKMEEEKLEQIRGVFANDHFATDNGAVIDDVADGYARVHLDLNISHCNALGAPMGGAIFTIADFAFAVATNWDGTVCVSQTSQITYLGRAKGKQLIAEAKRVREGRSTCFYLIEVNDELGSQVAHVTASGFVKR